MTKEVLNYARDIVIFLGVCLILAGYFRVNHIYEDNVALIDSVNSYKDSLVIFENKEKAFKDSLKHTSFLMDSLAELSSSYETILVENMALNKELTLKGLEIIEEEVIVREDSIRNVLRKNNTINRDNEHSQYKLFSKSFKR